MLSRVLTLKLCAEGEEEEEEKEEEEEAAAAAATDAEKEENMKKKSDFPFLFPPISWPGDEKPSTQTSPLVERKERDFLL